MWYVYFLQSKKSSTIYVGYTNDIKRRFAGHNNGKNISTKLNRPWQLKSLIIIPTIHQAKKLEKYFKTGSGKAILKKRILGDEAS